MVDDGLISPGWSWEKVEVNEHETSFIFGSASPSSPGEDSRKLAKYLRLRGHVCRVEDMSETSTVRVRKTEGLPHPPSVANAV